MSSTAAILLMLITTQAGPEAGQLVGTYGSVVIQRGEETISASARMRLIANDRIISAANSGAMILGIPQASLYVGSLTRMILGHADEPDQQRLVIAINPGEIRATPSAGRSVEVLTPLAGGVCDGPGTLRCSVQSRVVRYWAEVGPSTITLSENEIAARTNRKKLKLAGLFQQQGPNQLVLKEGESVEIRRDSGFENVETADPSEWTINPMQIASAIVGGSGSRLQAESAADRGTSPTQDQSPTSSQPTFESNDRTSQVAVTGGINFTLGTSFVSAAAGSSGGPNADANQGTLSGTLTAGFGSVSAGSAFPGNIHLVTGETGYAFPDISVVDADMFPTLTEYWSIGIGPVAKSQIVTDVLTGTDAVPTAIEIPQFDAYIVRLDQFGAPDLATGGGASTAVIGVTGLVGETPVGPGVSGATPLADDRARINKTATFALGEFAVRRDGETPVISMRRSDQDRRIVKDEDGNDNADEVTVNPDISQFNTTTDPRFFAPDKAVFVPAVNSLRNLPRYSQSELIRKAGFTVLTAERLQGFARRTGQTRFVVDGQIVDITGYQP